MDFTTARRAMVECQLATNNIMSAPILEAMGRVPRERFLPAERCAEAYVDEDVSIGLGRYLLEPMILGRLIQALDPKMNEVVLDVGSATGYSTAILSSLCETVLAVEPHETLMAYAQSTWRDLGLCNIADLTEDVMVAAAANAPFDMILVNGAVGEIPRELVAQLKEGTGRMVCVLRKNPQANGQAVLVKRGVGDAVSIVKLFDANVPYLEEFAPQEGFSF